MKLRYETEQSLKDDPGNEELARVLSLANKALETGDKDAVRECEELIDANRSE